jgi:hypothetical protein
VELIETYLVTILTAEPLLQQSDTSLLPPTAIANPGPAYAITSSSILSSSLQALLAFTSTFQSLPMESQRLSPTIPCLQDRPRGMKMQDA